MPRESMPWLREREGEIWTEADTKRVEQVMAEVEATYQRIVREAVGPLRCKVGYVEASE